MKLNNILLIIIAFTLGAVVTYGYSRIELRNTKLIAKRSIGNCIDTLSASQIITDSCSNAYSVVSTCFSDLQTCDLSESKKKLNYYNSQKNIGQTKFKQAEQDMDLILKDAERLLK
jgi:hypothetical protein